MKFLALATTALLCLQAHATSQVEVATPSNQEGTPYKHFVAHNETQTCTADEHATPFNNQIRGVNLGGWMVLEPWITPSLFYQFLGKGEGTSAMDMHSFCTVLGPEEGNKQLRRHWKTWVTEEIIEQLKDSGAVNSLRLPVGDWMYKPYGPYPGCTDGALDFVDDVLDWAYSNGLSVLIDIHAMKGSQNGFDNSGQCSGFKWTSILNNANNNDRTFEHWPIRSASWVGSFNGTDATYSDINYDNIQHSLEVIEGIVQRYKNHPAVLGIQPINEPWQYTPSDVLKKFYWDGYLIVKKHAPYWKYIMHDSFRLDTKLWGGFMKGCPDRALDTHIYQAWMDPSSRETFYNDACEKKKLIIEMEDAFGPVIVGEWSLATDNCAMWLNGFNDNLSGFPRLPCKYIPCADPYMGFDQPGTPVDPGKSIQGPYGTGMSTPNFGLCPVDRDWQKETKEDSGKDWMKAPPKAPHGKDATDEVMTNLAKKKISAFSGFGHGWYFWNFRTDLYEPHWSYMLALERGWIPKGNLKDDVISDACKKEDNGLYYCVAKRDQLEKSVRHNINYVLNVDGIVGKDGNKAEAYLMCNENTQSNETVKINRDIVSHLTGDELYAAADCAYKLNFKKHRVEGSTCDFGGTGRLLEVNKTFTDDDDSVQDSLDENFSEEVMSAETIGIFAVAVLLGSFIGFATAMRCNKKFKHRVSKSNLGKSMSKNAFLSRSFGGFSGDDYMEIPNSRLV